MTGADLNLVLLISTVTVLAGVAAVRVATRAGLPSLLLYLGIGLLIGEAGLGLPFEDTDLTMILGSVALALILAEGGLTTRWQVIRPVVALSAVLATVGVAISVAATAGLAYLLLDVDLRTALLLGAVVSSTDAAAVFSALRRLPLNRRLRATLEAESGFNDPPVIILVTVITASAWDEANAWSLTAQVLYQLVVGGLIGLLVARAGQWVLTKSALPSPGLYPLAAVTLVMLAFAVAGLAAASPFAAVYLAGLWLGNAKLPHRNATLGFAEGLAWLAQIGLFIMLGLLASPARLGDALLPALIVGSALLFVGRPLSIVICAAPFRVPWRQQVFMSWAGLRGAVPIMAATIPITNGLIGAERIFDVVFLLVVVFTLIQGPSLPFAARRLGVTDVGGSRDVSIDSAPLEAIDATMLQLRVAEESKLSGVSVHELRLPGNSVVTLILRDGEIFVPQLHTVLRARDQLLLATANREQSATEQRLRAVSRAGRLAHWRGELGQEVNRPRPAPIVQPSPPAAPTRPSAVVEPLLARPGEPPDNAPVEEAAASVRSRG